MSVLQLSKILTLGRASRQLEGLANKWVWLRPHAPPPGGRGCPSRSGSVDNISQLALPISLRKYSVGWWCDLHAHFPYANAWRYICISILRVDQNWTSGKRHKWLTQDKHFQNCWSWKHKVCGVWAFGIDSKLCYNATPRILAIESCSTVSSDW